MSRLAPILQGFFTDRLSRQRQASPHTITAYRDTCRLLLTFAWHATGLQPTHPSEFAMDASITPRGVLGSQPQHQPAQLGCRAPAAASVTSGLSPASLH